MPVVETKRWEDALKPYKDICDDGRRRADFNHDKFTVKLVHLNCVWVEFSHNYHVRRCVGLWDTVGSEQRIQSVTTDSH